MNGPRTAPAALLVAAAFAAASGGALGQRPPPADAGAEQQAPAEERSPAEEPAPGEEPASAAPEPAAGEQESAGQAPVGQQSASDASAEDGEPPYTVECGPDPETGGNVCLVDRGTYVGWRTFHAVCHTCHAQDAVGSTFAPDLLPRIRQIDKARFVMVVDQGFEGQVGVMPGWGENPNVNRYYDELWAYLRARADGELLPGRPKRLPEPDE